MKQTDMDLAPSTSTPSPPPSEPTAEQQARLAALRRYQWLSLYGPLLVLGLGIMATVIWLLWGTLAGPTAEVARVEVSAVADLIIIAASLPLTLACLLLPGLAIGLAIYDQGREMSRIAWLQRQLWRVDNGVNWVHQKTAETMPKIAQPITTANGWLAYLRTLAHRIWHTLR